MLVVSESGVDAYARPWAGVGAVLPAGTLPGSGCRRQDFDRDFAGALESNEVRVVIAMGSRALAAVRARHAAMPVVAAMVLRRSAVGAGVAGASTWISRSRRNWRPCARSGRAVRAPV